MESLAVKQNEAIFGLIQMCNSILASTCGVTIHFYILRRILRNHSSLNHYQSLIVVQSIVGVIYAVVQLLTNYRLTLTAKELMGFPFVPYGLIIERVLLFVNAVLYSLEQFLIMIFNIHRALILLRYNWIKRFYIVFTPFVLAYTTALGVARSLSFTQIEALMRLSFVPSIVVISVLCYILIKRHFRTQGSFSTKVKQMQARFSTSILLEGVIHGVLVLSLFIIVPLNLLVLWITDGDWSKTAVFSLFYMMIVLILFRWYSVAVGALTLWSIIGFLKQKRSQRADASVFIYVRQYNRNTPS